MRVPFVNIAAQHAPIKEELMAAVSAVIDHSRFILGPEVEEFECRFAEMCGVPYAVGVNSGTDALILALRALGIGEGDEVVTVPNSFVASAGCIVLAGAKPVFVDVGEDYNLDPSLLEAAITPKTKAILPVHLTGRPAAMDPIMDIANAHGLSVIEDAAQAVSAEYKGKPVGSIGAIGCFSLHPLKTLNACGDGGVLTTHDAGLYEEFKTLRNIGLKERDDCVVWGQNSRLDTMQAALLLAKLKYMEGWTQRRKENAGFYQQRLAGLPQVQTPVDQPYENSVYHTFVIQADHRDGLKDYLLEQGIGTAIHYPTPIHLHKAAAGMGLGEGSFPVTELLAKRILSLPVYPELERSELEHVADSVRSFYDVVSF